MPLKAGKVPIALVGVVLLAFALRLLDANARLSHDEGYSWLVAGAGTPQAFLDRLAGYENTPPLFYLLLAPLPLTDEFWLRVPSIVAGTAMVPLLYALVRPLLGTRAALLSALATAVAPVAVSYSDYSRGFMVAGVGLLGGLWAARRLVQSHGRRGRNWALYFAAGTWSLYSEYYAALPLIAIGGALVVLSPRRRLRTVGLAALPFVAFLPWLGQLIRSQDDLGHTKLTLSASPFSLRLIRDAIVPLSFGEHGTAASRPVQTVQALTVLIVVAWAVKRLHRSASREAFVLLGGVLIAVVVLQLIAAVLHTDVFRARYLTTLIPLGAAVLAGAVTSSRQRHAASVAAVVLLIAGTAVAVRRVGRQYEPDTASAVRFAQTHQADLILTNSAVVAFYARHLQALLDRPFGLGPGIANRCPARCAVIDDVRAGGARPAAGPRSSIGPLRITVLGGRRGG